MTQDEFLSALEKSMSLALLRQPSHPHHRLCSDGLALTIIPKDHSGPIEGVAWALGDRIPKRALKIHLTHKAFVMWNIGQFETLLPHDSEDGWFDLDDEKVEITMRLKVFRPLSLAER